MNEQETVEKLELDIRGLATELQATKDKLDNLYKRLLLLRRTENNDAAPLFKPKKLPGAEPVTMENYIGLRLIHVVGIVVLVIGLSIGVKYAIDKELISEMARVGLAYAAGVVLYILSWRLKIKYAAFSAILFSGAMASLYFTTYAAFVYYNLFSLPVAFVLMMTLTLFTVYTALRYDRSEIAVLGLVGAYAIPFLISTNSGRVDLFFLYISIINTAVVFLSYRKDWKGVAYIAQVVTWVLFLGWAATKYKPQNFRIGILFALLFFLLFMTNALMGRLLKRAALSVRDVQQVVVNNIALLIAALLLFSPSFSAKETGQISGLFALFTGAQTALFYYLFPAEQGIKKVLSLFSLFLFLVFVASQWDGLTVTLLWLATAVILFVWGVRSKAVWLRMSSIILMGVTLLKLATIDSLRFTTIQKIISYITLGILLLVVSFFYQKFKHKLFGEE